MVTPLNDAEATRVGEVFEAHSRFIETVARRHSHSAADVPDIVQAVGVQVCRKLRGFRGESGITTWLYRVTVNAAIDNWRAERSQVQAARAALQLLRQGAATRREANGQATPIATPADDTEREQVEALTRQARARALHEAIARLRPQYQKAAGEELAESAVLPHSKQTVRHRHRARRQLREVLSVDPRFT